MEKETGTTTQSITIETMVNAPVEKVWKAFSDPKDIVNWNHASDDWHAPSATNDLRTGGNFNVRMEAKDKSMGFDFTGIYDEVKEFERIAYTMPDNRKVEVLFSKEGDGTKIVETFDAENEFALDIQRTGWQAILDNFKNYVEAK